jgi:hypothetical protein
LRKAQRDRRTQARASVRPEHFRPPGSGLGNGRIAQDGVGLEDESGRGNCHGQRWWRARKLATASGSRRAARRAGRIGALSRPLLLTIAMSPLLTISAGFESIEMSPADVYSARYSAAAIHRNHQKKESHFVVDWRPWGRNGMRDFLDVVNDFPRDVLAKARSSMPSISLSLPKSDIAKPHDRFDSRPRLQK